MEQTHPQTPTAPVQRILGACRSQHMGKYLDLEQRKMPPFKTALVNTSPNEELGILSLVGDTPSSPSQVIWHIALIFYP